MKKAGKAFADNSTLRIMLIDDDPNDRTLIIQVLQNDFPGVEVKEIMDAEAMAQALQEHNFDLVITDYHLYWTDGIKNLRQVKSLYPDCPVIMFTGTGTEDVAVSAMKAGLDDYVLKSPKHFSRLPASVRLSLEKIEQRAATRVAEARYRDLYANVSIGLFRTTPEGIIVEANPVMLEILGESSLIELPSINLFDLYLDEKELRRWLVLIDKEGVARNKEGCLRRRTGEEIWVQNTIRSVRNNEGKVLFYEGSISDITARKELEDQVYQLHKMGSLGALTGGITHDFGNIMTAIGSYAELALQRIPEDAPAYFDIQGVNKCVARAISLTKLLGAFTHKRGARLREVNVNDLIINIRQMGERLIKKNIIFKEDLTDRATMVIAHPEELEQVFMNLVLNSRDAMPGGGIFTVKTRIIQLDASQAARTLVFKPGAYIEIEISDTGCGMEKDVLDHIFEPLYTTKGKGEGVGLGLAITYKIIKGFGGSISVESTPGKGTTFRILLPRCDADTFDQPDKKNS